MPKAFAVSSKDLSAGPTNPHGIWTPQFMALKRALDHGDDPENVLQALYDWFSYKGVPEQQLDAILDLEPDKALDALVHKIGAGLKGERLPPVARTVLQQALRALASRYVGKQGQDLDQRRSRLDAIQRRFSEGGLPARRVVERLLAL